MTDLANHIKDTLVAMNRVVAEQVNGPRVPPGTRCECRATDCDSAGHASKLGAPGQCTTTTIATRLVTVLPTITRERVMRSRLATGPGPAWKWLYSVDADHRGFDSIVTARRWQKTLGKQVPMCAACYAHHQQANGGAK